MLERGILTLAEYFEIDNVLCQQVFVFPREADIVQPGVVGINRNIDSGLSAA